jgi:hypothetical protein
MEKVETFGFVPPGMEPKLQNLLALCTGPTLMEPGEASPLGIHWLGPVSRWLSPECKSPEKPGPTGPSCGSCSLGCPRCGNKWAPRRCRTSWQLGRSSQCPATMTKNREGLRRWRDTPGSGRFHLACPLACNSKCGLCTCCVWEQVVSGPCLDPLSQYLHFPKNPGRFICPLKSERPWRV